MTDVRDGGAPSATLRPDIGVQVGRRTVLMGGLGLLMTTAITKSNFAPARLPPLIEDLEGRTFRFFWETANAENGLVPDRFPSPSSASIAAVGFALTAYPIGVERGYISREQAQRRVTTTLRFLYEAPQGPAAQGMAGYNGFFYHFLNLEAGVRSGTCELSTVDTALLMAGALFCGSYFSRDNTAEAEIRRLAEALYTRVDWRWAQARPPAICMGWIPEDGFLGYDWRGYNEAMIVYLLALGSPTFAVAPEAWSEWESTYDRSWGPHYGEPHLGFAPLFGHQYSPSWIDFRGIQCAYMRRRGIDYFENNRRAIYAQRAYAIANPGGWKGYDADVWGVTACDGPADVKREYAGELRTFRSYAGRGAGGPNDDGTLAPTAVAASIAYAPEIVIPAILAMQRRYGKYIYAQYGFLDAFNPSFDFDDVPLRHGRHVPGLGWVASDYLGIDQGPIIAMIENYRNGFVWRVMQSSTFLRRGLEQAGFTGGWLGVLA